MARYNSQDVIKYISKAIARLNKARGLNIVLLNLESTVLIGYNFINAHLYDKTLQHKFGSMLNKIIFTEEDTMSNLDKEAGISDKELDDDTKTIIRIAYIIWEDWKETRNDNVD